MTAAAPTTAADGRTARRRLAGVDAARGTALLGMMSVHVFPVDDADGGTTLAHTLAAGRSAALFAVLAGVGLALATGGRRPPGGERWLRWSLALPVRAALVGLVGLLLGGLDTGVAVILAYYAVLFLAAVPLLGLGPPVLGALAVTAALAAPWAVYAVRDDLPRAPSDSPTLVTLLTEPGQLLQTITLTGYYPVLGWLAYLCAGLAVGRLALDRRRTAVLLLGGGAALALAASAASALLLGPLGGYDRIEAVTRLGDSSVEEVVARGRFGTVPTTTPWWLATDAPHSTTPPDLLHTTGTALAVLGALLLLAPLLPRLLAPLAAAGSMPLTLYSAHLLVLAAVDDVDPLVLWGSQAVAFLLLAWLWRRLVGRGPLEAVVGSLTDRVAGRRWDEDPPPGAGATSVRA